MRPRVSRLVLHTERPAASVWPLIHDIAWKTLVAIIFLSFFPAVSTAAEETEGDVILVQGAAGSEAFGKQFTTWADRWQAAASGAHWNVHRLGSTPPALETDRDHLKRLLKDLSSLPDAHASDRKLWVVLVGHGTDDTRDARFNLTGPDFTAEELAEWLSPIKTPIAVINCSSASGSFLKVLSKPGRVVVTATRNGSELNFAHFGDAMSQAWTESRADRDKDGQVSLWEAFLRATAATEAFYSDDGRLATEHAQIDDDGDGTGLLGLTYLAKTDEEKLFRDGGLSRTWVLVPSATERKIPRELRRQRDELEQKLLAVRRRRADLFGAGKSEEQGNAAYLQELEAILLPLAKLGNQIEVAIK